MFFYLSKIIGVFLDPFWWIVGLMAIATYRTFKKKVVSKKLWAVVTIAFLFFSNGGPISLLNHAWKVPPNSLKDVDSANIAIVLGGYAGYNDVNEDLDWHKPADRLLYPLKWYKEGKVKKILLTGGNASILGSDQKESDLVAQWLIALGVSPSDVLVDSESRNTIENAVYAKELLKGKNKDIIVVTSQMHGRRAKAVFDKVGVPHNLVVVDQSAPFELGSFLSFSTENLLAWKYALHEIIGYGVYAARGHV